MTSGKETISHSNVALDGVCAHAPFRDLAFVPPGVRGLFVGVMSGSGNARGWLRVETIVAMDDWGIADYMLVLCRVGIRFRMRCGRTTSLMIGGLLGFEIL